MHIQEAIEKLESGSDLTRPEARDVMECLLSGSVPDPDIVALLVALRDKGEQTEELIGFAEVMRARAAEHLRGVGVDVDGLSRRDLLLDTCGTGGDEQGTLNVSTATALVAAAAGVRVGMVFLFAPHLHLAMKHVTNARRALKTKTVYNLLGPLTNPLGASIQLLGVYDRALTAMMAHSLSAIGTRRAFVVAAWDGTDEISTTGPTQLSEVDGAGVKT